MTLKSQITEDMKTAMRAKEATKLATIRLLLAAIKQKEVDERIELDDAAVLAVIEKMLKQRKDSISQYEAAKRQDLADIEKQEAAILTAYMPAALGTEELQSIVAAAVASIGANSPGDMGKVVALVKPQVAGRADMGEVSRLIKASLSGL